MSVDPLDTTVSIDDVLTLTRLVDRNGRDPIGELRDLLLDARLACGSRS
jgi:hypothetical protein